MRPNLSVQSFAGALAVLGTTVLMACGDSKPANSPVNGNEAAPASDKAAGDGGAEKKSEGSCGANKAAGASCGAGKTGGDAKPAEPAAAVPAAPAEPAAAAPAADAKPDAKPAKPAGKAPAKKPAAKKGGASACGAGTCGAKK